MELPPCECGCGGRVTKPGNRFIYAHHIRLPDHGKRPLCACGCGETTEGAAKFVRDHEKRGESELPFCACGCGQRVKRRQRLYVWGHHQRLVEKSTLTARISRGHAGFTHTEEARRKQSEAKKRFFASGGQVWNKGLTKDIHPSIGLHNRGQFQSTADHYDRSFPSTSTSIEAIVQIALWERGLPFLFNVPVRHVCRPDFLFPDAKIVLNVDAAYWHRDRKDKDSDQDATLLAEGWLVFRWEEKDIRRDLQTLLDHLEGEYHARRGQ